jgi:uncharacterized protein (UPF0333 family)
MCPGCNATITAPDGTKSTVTADANGNIQLPLSAAGTYQVTNGQSAGVLATAAPAPAPQNATQPVPTTTSSGPDYTWLIVLIVVIIILAGAYYYWSSRKKK